jgi:hypothetical protein
MIGSFSSAIPAKRFSQDAGEEFDTVWNAAEREGWSTYKIANEWLHGCPRCGVPS